MPVYKRILLKLSGESLMGAQKYGLDTAVLNSYATQIKAVVDSGVQVGIVIGGGNIGRKVATEVQSFGANVIYYDAFRLSEEREKEFHMEYKPLEELVKEADVITLHVPLLDSTKHMIGEKQFEEMKDHVIIVNTARGGLIDDEALAKALVNGKVAAAGLDCVENENLQENSLARMSNVILTPHMGGSSNDLAAEMIPKIAEQIKNLEMTGTIGNVVNKEYLK